jgi:hypothetical protein
MCQTGLRMFLALTFVTSVAAGAEPFEPIFELKPEGGLQRFITRNEFEFTKLRSQIERTAFMAICTNQWPSGLVPIFAVEKTNRIDLRRRPPHGQENYTTPLFFALPPEDEPDAAKLAGHWEGTADRPGGTKDFPAFEFTLEGDQIAGRFDQNTQYRYAYVSGGTFRSNRLEVRVDYMNESWFLSANWTEGMLKGTWRREDNAEQGAWEVTREPAQLPKAKAVPLYEWRRTSDDARRYGTGDFGPEWKRSARPLCRVWPGK